MEALILLALVAILLGGHMGKTEIEVRLKELQEQIDELNEHVRELLY